MAETATMRIAGEATRSLPKRFAFNATNLASVKCPPDQDRCWVYDVKTTGLAMMTTASGTKNFYYYRKIAGRPERIKIGPFPDVAVEQARKISAEMTGDTAAGLNPVEERRKATHAITLGQLWAQWLIEHAKPNLRPKTIVSDESRYSTCLSCWSTRRLTSITESDVRALHRSIGRDRGRTNANRAIELLRRLFNYQRIQPNPAAGNAVTKFREVSRSRFVQLDELPRLFKALDKLENQTMKDLFLVALWTGQRRSNVQGMRWSDVDLDAATWTIPGDQAKEHESISVPLSPPAIAILKARKPATDADFVFPSRSKTGHVVEPKKVWHDVLEAAGIEDLHVHDLRRTLAAFQAAGGTSLPIIGRSLGHKSQQATAIYARVSLDPVRVSVDAAAAAMTAAAAGRDKPE